MVGDVASQDMTPLPVLDCQVTDLDGVSTTQLNIQMLGLGLLFILAITILRLALPTKLFKTWKSKLLFLFVILGPLAFYPTSYKYSTSYANFLKLCDQPKQYQVLRTKNITYLYVSDRWEANCKKGPSIIGTATFAGFDYV